MKSLLRDVYHVYRAPLIIEVEFPDLIPYLSHDRDAIDVGANFGIFTNFLARRSRFVYAIEPVPQNFRALCWMIGTYRLPAIPIMAAASNSNGIVRFNLGPSLYESHVTNGTGDFTARSITIDSLGLDPSFIKIDVEGHETEVLMGAKETIERSRPAILMEIGNKDSSPVLLGMGYRKIKHFTANALFVSECPNHRE